MNQAMKSCEFVSIIADDECTNTAIQLRRNIKPDGGINDPEVRQSMTPLPPDDLFDEKYEHGRERRSEHYQHVRLYIMYQH